MAAGCPALLKPSEISPATSSVLADLYPKYLDQSAYRVINGGVPEVTYLLKLKWDHSAWIWDIPAADRWDAHRLRSLFVIISHLHGKWNYRPHRGEGGG